MDYKHIINRACLSHYRYAMQQCESECPRWTRFRTCCATVAETHDYFLLKSYNTVVAVIDKDTHSVWDVLSYVYGYTSTSAQHIVKFAADYGHGNRYTWRDIPR